MSSDLRQNENTTIRSPQERCIARYDKLYYATKGNKTQRFDMLKPEIVDRLFVNRPSYDYTKKIAVARLENNLYDQLKFLATIHNCKNNDLSSIENLSHNVFNWNYDDFLKRRELENTIWVDVLKLNDDVNCLEWFKTKIDLGEIQSYAQLIFKGLYAILGQKEFHMEEQIWEKLRSAESYLNISNILENEQKILRETISEKERLMNAELASRRRTLQQMTLWGFEEAKINSDIWDPIEMRFKVNWYQSKVKQTQCKRDMAENEYHNQIENYKQKMINERMCLDSICDTYYSLAEQHKQDMNSLQDRYDLEFDRIDNELNYNRLQIDKLRNQQLFLTEEIQRFHEEIKIQLENEERKRKKEEEKLKELEEEALLESEQKLKLKLKNKKTKTVAKTVARAKTGKRKSKSMK